MFCSRCGHELPSKINACPVCDTPKKRKQRSRQRLLLGLVIFLAGAMVGSLLDSFLFKGKAWKYTFLGGLGATSTSQESEVSNPTGTTPQASTSSQIPETEPVGSGFGAGVVPDGASHRSPKPDEPASVNPASSTYPASPAIDFAVDLPAPVRQASDAPIIGIIASQPASGGEELISVVSAKIPDCRLSFEKADSLEESPDVSYHGSFSPDGKTLVFSSNRSIDGKPGLFQCYFKNSAPGANSVRAFPWNGNVWTPELSADGKKVVFSSDSSKPEHIFLLDRESKQGQAITNGPSKNMMPAISPDGKFIAFVSNRRGSNDIWIIGTDSKNLIQITFGPEDDREPRWWPDGKSLVFTRIKEKFKYSLIERVSLDPLSSPQPLFKESSRQWLADPSPDGRFLAFVRSKDTDGSGNAIFVRRLDSGAEFTIDPFKGGECYRPIWTRDCTGIVFHADRQNRKSLFLAKLKRAPIE
ncbi:hypothetical protein AUK22_08645 [bacterium CG2_30_54_10]|nr:MAG: hypothetical protein AUK22_08645 [bacterium CG2_30_54_10]